LGDEQHDSLLSSRQLWHRHDAPLSTDHMSFVRPGNAEVTRVRCATLDTEWSFGCSVDSRWTPMA
jgi:hypothetical protein